MKYLISILGLFISLLLSAQSSGVKGLVISDTTKEPLVSASILVGETGIWTELDGTFQMDLPQGTYDVSFTYLGFDDFSATVTVSENQYTTLEVSLKETSNILQQVTLVQTKYERRISDSPVSISVLNPELIESANTTNIEDIVDRTPGVQMINGQANIRGGSGWSFGSASRVMLLIDEMPALQIDAGRPNWEDIPVENIHQIEVIKGASSVLYGSSALNGIIHVRTKYATSTPVTKITANYSQVMKPRNEAAGWWLDSDEYGAPNEMAYSILHKQKFKKFDIVGAAFYADEKRVYEDPDGGHMRRDRLRFSLNTRYRLTDKTTLELNGFFTRNHTQDPFLWLSAGPSIYQSLPGAFLQGTNTRFYIDPKFTHYNKKGNVHKVFGRLYSVSNDNTNNQSNSSLTGFMEYQYLRKFRNIGMILTTGASSSFTSSNSEIFGGETITQDNVAAYVQVDKKVGDKVNITIGGRLENFTQNTVLFPNPENKDTELEAIGRFGLAYEVSEYTFFRASIGQGYRYPSITERFVKTTFGGNGTLPNPDLQSEKGWTSEIGFKQGFTFLGFNGFFDVAAFWSQYQDMAEFNFNSVGEEQGFQSVNIGDTDIKGIEVNLIGATTIANIPINILAGYTYLDPKYQDFEGNDELLGGLSDPINVLKYRSKHNLKADVEGGYKSFKAGVSVARVSNVPTVDALLEVPGAIGLYRELNNTGYSTLEARLSYKLEGISKIPGNSIKLSLVGKNVLNEEYTLRPGLAEKPRNVSVRVEFTL